MRRLASATVLPATTTTSASLGLLMISSGVCFLFAISSPFFAQDPNICLGPVSGVRSRGVRAARRAALHHGGTADALSTVLFNSSPH